MSGLTFYSPRVLGNALSDFDSYLNSFLKDTFAGYPERIYKRLPSVDMRETEKTYSLEAELPGFDENDIEVRLDGTTLTIESQKTDERKVAKEADGSEETAKQEGSYLLRERSLSSFSRSFKLPENADRDGVSASFKNGVLHVEITKKPEAQRRVIQIEKK